MRVYLAGPITGLTFGAATDWRKDIASTIRRMGHTALSPLRGKEYLADEGVLEKTYGNLNPISSAKGIFGRDHFDVTTCDILFVNLLGAERVSIGTVMEIALGRAAGKYVLVLTEPDSLHDHPFIQEAASLVVGDYDMGVMVLSRLLATD